MFKSCLRNWHFLWHIFSIIYLWMPETSSGRLRALHHGSKLLHMHNFDDVDFVHPRVASTAGCNCSRLQEQLLTTTQWTIFHNFGIDTKLYSSASTDLSWFWTFTNIWWKKCAKNFWKRQFCREDFNIMLLCQC